MRFGFFLYVCVWSGVWGVDGGWMPLPTRPQRYCDPASLVLYFLVFKKSSLNRSGTTLVTTPVKSYIWPKLRKVTNQKSYKRLHFPRPLSHLSHPHSFNDILRNDDYETKVKTFLLFIAKTYDFCNQKL